MLRLRMSSPSFEVTLRPDPRLHYFVLTTGVAALLVGTVIIAHLNLSLILRWAAAMVWITDCCVALWSFNAGFARVRMIRLNSAGLVTSVEFDAEPTCVMLQTGSMILDHLAWIRLAEGNRFYYAGLFVRRLSSPAQWHRLQLLWRQSRAAFGHPVGP